MKRYLAVYLRSLLGRLAWLLPLCLAASSPCHSQQPPPPTSAEQPLFFNETFDDSRLNPLLEDIDTSYVLEKGNAGTRGKRSYIRTVRGDYLTQDFIADVYYVTDAGGGDAGLFWGIGTAEKNTAFYNEPLHSVFVLDFATDFQFPGIAVRKWTDISDDSTSPQVTLTYDSKTAFDGSALGRITKRGDAITFAADLQYDGANFRPTFTRTFSLSKDLSFLDKTNGHLFFGTGTASGVSRARFERFVVRPLTKENDAKKPSAGSQLSGKIIRMEPGKWTMVVTTITDKEGKTISLSPPRNKEILLPKGVAVPPGAKVGATVRVSGVDGGVGKPLTAQTIEVVNEAPLSGKASEK